MKTILITGAGSGLGKALSEVFSKNGWDVIATTKENLDVSSQESIEYFVTSLNNKPIDVLINCAGLYDSTGDDKDFTNTIPQITKVFQVNVIGAVFITDKLLNNLEKGEEKLVISISSGMGTFAELNEYHAQHWVYSASKTALNYSMLSFNLLHPNIKCVLINPGWMKTKIGGPDATIEPSKSAVKIFDLVNNHKEKLPNGKLVDYDGNLMDF